MMNTGPERQAPCMRRKRPRHAQSECLGSTSLGPVASSFGGCWRLLTNPGRFFEPFLSHTLARLRSAPRESEDQVHGALPSLQCAPTAVRRMFPLWSQEAFARFTVPETMIININHTRTSLSHHARVPRDQANSCLDFLSDVHVA